jgi:hypothetical protein
MDQDQQYKTRDISVDGPGLIILDQGYVYQRPGLIILDQGDGYR